jgi:hypothetical protein
MDKKLPAFQNDAEVIEPTTDLSPIDMEKIQKFAEAGLPGLATVDEPTLARMMNLYLEGKPYTQIARLVKVDKPLVLYLSHRFNWYLARREYLHELEATIRNRIIESKIVSQDFLLQLTHLWQKKIGKKINQYLSTEDDSHADGINLKEVDKYLKTIEMLHKITTDGPSASKPQAPAVGLNLGDGVTIKKIGENEVEVTPKNKSIGEMLKQFADYRRDESNKKESDISEEGKGEDDEK